MLRLRFSSVRSDQTDRGSIIAVVVVVNVIVTVVVETAVIVTPVAGIESTAAVTAATTAVAVAESLVVKFHRFRPSGVHTLHDCMIPLEKLVA